MLAPSGLLIQGNNPSEIKPVTSHDVSQKLLRPFLAYLGYADSSSTPTAASHEENRQSAYEVVKQNINEENEERFFQAGEFVYVEQLENGDPYVYIKDASGGMLIRFNKSMTLEAFQRNAINKLIMDSLVVNKSDSHELQSAKKDLADVFRIIVEFREQLDESATGATPDEFHQFLDNNSKHTQTLLRIFEDHSGGEKLTRAKLADCLSLCGDHARSEHNNGNQVMSDAFDEFSQILKGLYKLYKDGHTPGAQINTAHMTHTKKETYTYLRCYYRTDPLNYKPTTSYVWALDPNSNDYYRVPGQWHSKRVLENMFYSDTSQEELHAIAQSTLERKGISAPVAMITGANTVKSSDYVIWSNDPSEQGEEINKVIAFGDSLSDGNNMRNISHKHLPTDHNYYAGRFSNGPVWVDYLSETLNVPLYNWAIGGAAAADAYGGIIPGLSSQVESWSSYMAKAQNYRPENTLFTVLIGANDLINYSRTVPSIIKEAHHALEGLIATGGKNILLLNLPDVSRAPAFQFKTEAEGKKIAEQVAAYNLALQNLVDTLRENHPDVNIQLFDTCGFLNEVLNNPTAFDVTNTTDSALKLDSDGTSNYLEQRTPREECLKNPKHADDYVFWDLLHPTTKAHKQLATMVFSFIKANGFGHLFSSIPNDTNTTVETPPAILAGVDNMQPITT